MVSLGETMAATALRWYDFFGPKSEKALTISE
jgi:hypothetical protein